MSDLKVDYVRLERAHRTAEDLKKAFDGLPEQVAASIDCWGDNQVAAAVRTFGTNWSYHREKLSELIEQTGEKMQTCLETFRKADGALARSFDAGSGGRGSE